MEKERTCLQCHYLFIPVRNPQQRFCSRHLCQNARKSNWRRAKHKLDPAYRDNQNRACKKWRKKNPNYWKHYRNSHPGYTDCNRHKQRQRKQILGKKLLYGSQASQFANSDALNPIKNGTYKLIPTSPEFANRDALIVQISCITNGLR
jgi:hypothetical protein